MRDMFDDFLRELAERQARAQGGQPDRPTQSGGQPHGGEPGDDAPGDDEGESGAGGQRGPDTERGAGAAEDQEATREPGGSTSEHSTAGEEAGEEAGDEADHGTPEEPVAIGRRPAGRRARSAGPGGGRPPRRPGGPDDGASTGERLRRLGPQALLALIIALLLAAVLLVGVGLDLSTDAIWFKSIGFDGVFWTRIGAQAGLFVLGLVVALVALLGNLWLAGRLAPPADAGPSERVRGFMRRLGDSARAATEGTWSRYEPYGGRRRGGFGQPGDTDRPPTRPPIAFGTDEIPNLTPIAIVVIIVVAVVAALGTAGTLGGNWETVLLWQHRVPFATAGAAAVVDPVFGRDISFYLFELPFLRLVQSLAGSLLIATLVVAGGRYLVAAARGGGFPTRVRVHVGILAGLYLLTIAAGYQLDKLELVYSARGVATGVSYTDQAAQFFAFDALTIVTGLVAALLVGGAFTRWVWPLGAAVAVWLGLSILLGDVYPAVIQKFTVEPNQQAQELPYVVNNIKMTRLAFGLSGWTSTPYGGAAPLTPAAINQDAATFQNARLWDYRPLQTALEQIQTVRQYYQFVDVDTDRYAINGAERQVMLSARELAPENLPQAGSWVNQKITYTHGFGLAMVPVNEVGAQGMPQLFIKDLPPVVSGGAPAVSQPRIYFGERPNDWVLVGAKQPEFDYPIGTSDQGGGSTGQQTETRWTGTTGIKLDSLLTRLLFAARFRDLNLLISDQVTDATQLLMHRSLGDRLNLVAPFLAYDKDPYLVVTGGHLVYVQDAYTLTDRFPNAQAFDDSQLAAGSGLAGASFDYLRNSVKIVMDAYDGSMSFYIADPSDPLVRAWSGVFPTLFKSLDQMPADLRAHLRTPEELFNVQTAMFARYHMTDPAVFYQSNDLWKVPQASATADTATGALPTEAYYVYMRMPGQANPEFLLLQPMVPAKRPNMIAWIAARNDAPNLGQVNVFQFPDNSSVFGPDQIESRIEAEPAISAQLSLWRQGGSTVVLGNLIVVPVQDSIIYLQPIYLQATKNSIPALTKVVVASPTTVVWGNSLGDALTALLAGGPGPTPTPTPTPGPSASPGVSPTPSPTSGPTGTPNPTDIQALVRYANAHFEAAQAALRQGDFATYGIEMAEVQRTLARLDALVGGSPSPTP